MNNIFVIVVIIIILILLWFFITHKHKSNFEMKDNNNHIIMKNNNEHIIMMKGGNVESEYSEILPSSSNSFEYSVKRTNGKPLYIQLRSEPLTNWKNVEKHGIQTKVLVDSPAYFFDGSIYWLYVPIERIGNIAWSLVKRTDLPVYGPREKPYTKTELNNKIKKYGKIPSNIHIISTNHRPELAYSLFLRPYSNIDPDVKMTSYGDEWSLTVNEFKDWFYNPHKPISYYHKLIDEWSYFGIKDYEHKLKKFMNMDCTNVFKLASLDIYPLEKNTSDFFSRIKLQNYSDNFTRLFNDVVVCNEIEKEINYGNNEILLYVYNIEHMSRVSEFLTRYFHNSIYDKHIQQILEITENNHVDLSNEFGTLVMKLRNQFNYDVEAMNTNYSKWKLRTINEMDQNHLWICHDSAYYVSELLKKKSNVVEVHRCSQFEKQSNRRSNVSPHSHGFCIFKLTNGEWYSFDACHSLYFGVRGPFSSADRVISNFANLNKQGGDIIIYVDKIIPGARFNDFTKN